MKIIFCEAYVIVMKNNIIYPEKKILYIIMYMYYCYQQNIKNK